MWETFKSKIGAIDFRHLNTLPLQNCVCETYKPYLLIYLPRPLWSTHMLNLRITDEMF